MNQSTAQSTLDCFRKTVAHEGWGALYKGFIPNYMRLGPWNMVVCSPGLFLATLIFPSCRRAAVRSRGLFLASLLNPSSYS